MTLLAIYLAVHVIGWTIAMYQVAMTWDPNG